MAAQFPLKYEKRIYDNVHGSIGITSLERKIIDTPIFQRLHRIGQLGPAYFVYPGATHSRFSHSLGALFIMNQYLENVPLNGSPILSSDDKDEWQKLRLAALLHDVGHYPFSHSLEVPITQKFNGHDHEEHSIHIIEKILKDKLGTYMPSEITDIIKKKKVADLRDNVKAQLISSDFDIDKLDYLLRDSYHTGVAYGYVDADRLLRTMEFDEQGNVIFRKPGPVIENFLLGRYHMYQAVYYHKTVIAFELMIERIYELLVQEGKLQQPDDILNSTDEMILSEFDDFQIWHAMFDYYKEHKDNFLGELIRQVISRQPIKLAVLATSQAKKKTKPNDVALIELMKTIPQVRNKLVEKIKTMNSNFDENWIFFFAVPKPISLLPDDTVIYVKRKDEIIKLNEDESLIFKQVGDYALYDARIYSQENFRNETLKAFESVKI